MNVNYTSKNVIRRASSDINLEKKKERGFTQLGELPIIGLLISIAGGMLSLIVMFSLVPVIGASVDEAMPTVDSTSPWSSADLPSGVSLWETIGPLLVLCALVAVVMIVLKLIGVF